MWGHLQMLVLGSIGRCLSGCVWVKTDCVGSGDGRSSRLCACHMHMPGTWLVLSGIAALSYGIDAATAKLLLTRVPRVPCRPQWSGTGIESAGFVAGCRHEADCLCCGQHRQCSRKKSLLVIRACFLCGRGFLCHNCCQVANHLSPGCLSNQH